MSHMSFKEDRYNGAGGIRSEDLWCLGRYVRILWLIEGGMNYAHHSSIQFQFQPPTTSYHMSLAPLVLHSLCLLYMRGSGM